MTDSPTPASTSHPRPDDSAAWQAFLALAEECTPEERAAWEQSLADDPAACDALAEMTELVLAVREVERVALPEVAPRPPVRASHRMAIAAAWALAGVVLVGLAIVWQTYPQGVDTVERPQVATPSEMPTWVDSATLVAATSLGSPADWDHGLLGIEEPTNGLEPAGELDVPEWMLAAVRLSDTEDQP